MPVSRQTNIDLSLDHREQQAVVSSLSCEQTSADDDCTRRNERDRSNSELVSELITFVRGGSGIFHGLTRSVRPACNKLIRLFATPR
jgi:hypothetical protein